jgi:hypothetical protein
VKRVRVQSETYTHTYNAQGAPTGKPKVARAYALVNEDGTPVFVGLFADESKAAEFCKARGWRLVK